MWGGVVGYVVGEGVVGEEGEEGEEEGREGASPAACSLPELAVAPVGDEGGEACA